MENNFNYKRIIILGGSGSGKSSLVNRIGLYTGYPVYSLDALLHDINWNKKDRSKWEEICQQSFLNKDIGVVDGNYTSILINRVNWADLVIFIEAPTWLLFYRNIFRFFKIELGIEKRNGGYPESRNIIKLSHLLWVLGWNKNSRKKVFSILKSVESKKILIIKKPRDLNLDKLLK